MRRSDIMSSPVAANAASSEEKKERPELSLKELTREWSDVNAGHRLNLAPGLRIAAAGMVGGSVGLAGGLYRGWARASLRYLAENAHRMPTTKGGWYFYHKRKNYVVLQGGLATGLVRGAKYGAVSAGFFALEAYIDQIRGTIDFFSTMASAGTVGVAYGLMSGLMFKQALRSSKQFLAFGTMAGLMEDFIRYKRGYEVWYLGRGRTMAA